MNNIPIHNVWFDDAATMAMGEAFDRTCESIRIIGSTVPVREIACRGYLAFQMSRGQQFEYAPES